MNWKQPKVYAVKHKDERSYGRLRCDNDTKIKERNKKVCQITIASKAMFCFRQ